MLNRHNIQWMTALALALLLPGMSGLLLAADGSGTDPNLFCRTTTLDMGTLSGYGNGQPIFLGEDRVIRGPAAWRNFWGHHQSIFDPGRPLPDVDFRTQIVIAAMQGMQTSGGGPSITIVGLRRSPTTGASTDRQTTTVVIVDDDRPGPLDVITSPYHIVTVPRQCVNGEASLGFRHLAPDPSTGIIQGRVYAPSNVIDWRPVQGARVELTNADGTRRVKQTGRDGSYFFVRVAPGGYELGVNMPPYLSERTQLTVEEGSVEFWDFYLTLPGGTPSGAREEIGLVGLGRLLLLQEISAGWSP